MTLNKPLFVVSVLAMAAFVVGLAVPASANVYASGLTVTGDKSISYILNENADTGIQMQVWQVGGGMVYSQDLGALDKGTHNWTWNGAGGVAGNSYSIKIVASSAGHTGWTKISDDSTLCQFENPRGLAVNTYQNTANFGKIYVSNVRTSPTATGRAMQNGTYALNADCTDDGFHTGGVAWTNTSTTTAARHGCVGPDGHLYLADYSNDLAYEFSEDMSTATLLIDGTNKTANQWVRDICVTGTGADRKIYLANPYWVSGGDLSRTGIVGYDLGTNTRVTPGDTGTEIINFADNGLLYPYDVKRDSAGDWYSSQYRATAGTGAPLIKWQDGSAPIGPGNIMWQADQAYTYNNGFDIYEPGNLIAYCNFYSGDGSVYIFDMATGAYVDQFATGTETYKTPRDIAFDAAGNIVTVDNYTERMRIWSPGGENSFTTTSYFAFDVVPEPSSMLALLAGIPGLLIFKRRRH